MSTTAAQLWRSVARVPRLALMGLIRLYQVGLSPLLGPRCKYYPSCSHYGLEAVRVHGAFAGGALAAWRVLRCNPWSNGGVDDVPQLGERLFRRTRNNAAMTTPSVAPARTTYDTIKI